MNEKGKSLRAGSVAFAALLSMSLALTSVAPSVFNPVSVISPASIGGMRAYAAQGDAAMRPTQPAHPSPASSFEPAALQAQDGAFEEGKAYTMPVRMLKRAADDASMASPVMHPTAYAVFENGMFTVKAYFVNAPIMGSTIYAGSLGAATYDKTGDGTMVPADSDVYDKKTQVKTVTMTLASLDEPVAFHLDMFMDNVRLVFDTSQTAEAVAEPTFPEIESSEVKYPAESVAVIGGAGYESANALACCPNGSLVVAGSTTSTDQSFSGRETTGEQAFLSVCSEDGEVVSTSYLTGADGVSLFDLSAAHDSSFFTCGYFQTKDDETATGDFEGLDKEGCVGSRNAFVAKYSANNKLLWARSLCSTQACQYDGVAATSDGGCVAVAEYLRGGSASDYAGEITGVVNTIVVKYDASGEEEWHTILTGSSVIDTDGAIAVTERGTYLVAGSFAFLSANGMLSSLERFGGTFDLYVVELDAQGALVNARSYGGSATNESSCDIIPTSDGGYAFAGYTGSNDATFASSPAAPGATNGFLVKCGSDGVPHWVSTCKSTQDNEASRVVEIGGEFVVIGYGEGKDGDFTELAKGQKDAYVARYDAAGHRTSLRTFGGSKNDYASGVAGVEDGRFVLLFQSESSDVDLEGIARGESDALLVWTSEQSAEDAQHAADSLNASTVEELVDALPDPWDVEESDAQAIAAARKEFNALTVGATALVSENCVTKLQLAEAAIDLSASGRLAVRRFVEQVESFPAAPGVKDATAVAQARRAYDALSDYQKVIVPDQLVKALESAEKSVSSAQAVERVKTEAAAYAAAHTIASVKVTGSYVYTGKAIKPAMVVATKDGSKVDVANYSIAYVNNKDAGTAAVTVTGKGAYRGAATATFVIAPASIAKAKVVLKAASRPYTGKAQRGAVKSVALDGATLKAGTDYAVSAKSGKKAGSYQVTVAGMGNYKGTATATYKVTPAAAKAKVVVSKTVKSSALKKVVTYRAVKLTTDGKATYKVVKKDARKVLSFKSGKVTVKKGAKVGSYSIKVRVSAKTGKNYKALKAKTYTIKVKVK